MPEQDLLLVPARRGMQMITDACTHKPVRLSLRCRAAGAVFSRPESPGRRASFYLTLVVPPDQRGLLGQVHAMTGVDQGPFNPSQGKLLVKLPFGGRRFLCKVRDGDGMQWTPYDIRYGADLALQATFGGVWPGTTGPQGYTWLVDDILLSQPPNAP